MAQAVSNIQGCQKTRNAALMINGLLEENKILFDFKVYCLIFRQYYKTTMIYPFKIFFRYRGKNFLFQYSFLVLLSWVFYLMISVWFSFSYSLLHGNRSWKIVLLSCSIQMRMKRKSNGKDKDGYYIQFYLL